MERSAFRIQKCKFKSILCALMGKKIALQYIPIHIGFIGNSKCLWQSPEYRCELQRHILTAAELALYNSTSNCSFQVLTLDRAAGNLLNEPSPQAFHGALWFFSKHQKFLSVSPTLCIASLQAKHFVNLGITGPMCMHRIWIPKQGFP